MTRLLGALGESGLILIPGGSRVVSLMLRIKRFLTDYQISVAQNNLPLFKILRPTKPKITHLRRVQHRGAISVWMGLDWMDLWLG